MTSPSAGVIGNLCNLRMRHDTNFDLEQSLIAWRAGKADAEAVLNREVYGLLKRMAAARLHAGGPRTLEVTGLVHEAVVRLLGSESDWTSRGHFLALVALQMRAVLVDDARRRSAGKRGGGAAVVTLGGADEIAVGDSGLLDLHDALLALSGRDQRTARVVELTYFGGLSAREISTALGISDATVERDLAFGRAWLQREFSR